MAKRPGGRLAARPLHFIWIADGSGSMEQGGKIQALNNAVREATPHMRQMADQNPYADVLVRAVRFADGSYGAGWNGVAGPVRGLLFGDGLQLVAQLIGVAVNLVFVFGLSYGFFKLTDRLMGNRVPAEVDDSHFGGVPGAGRRLLEEQRHTLAGQRRVSRRVECEPEEVFPLVDVEIVEVEEVAHGPDPSPTAIRRSRAGRTRRPGSPGRPSPPRTAPTAPGSLRCP